MTVRARWGMRATARWAGFLVALVVAAGVGCATSSDEGGGTGFDVMEKSITELAAALDAGEVTSRELVTSYLARIEAFDQRGPALNTMVVINPNAVAAADARDAERAEGRARGPLHGIPVVVKDNYDTADMPTSGGAIGLATSGAA